jgi:hypothetical protein
LPKKVEKKIYRALAVKYIEGILEIYDKDPKKAVSFLLNTGVITKKPLIDIIKIEKWARKSAESVIDLFTTKEGLKKIDSFLADIIRPADDDPWQEWIEEQNSWKGGGWRKWIKRLLW